MKVLRFRAVQLPVIVRCGVLFSTEGDNVFPRHFTWTNSAGGGNTTITNTSGLPIKVKIYKDGVLVVDSGYFGNPTHQSNLNAYNSANYQPSETINNVMTFNTLLTGIVPTTFVDIKVYSPLIGGSFNLFIDC